MFGINDRTKDNVIGNYYPIACSNLLLTGIFATKTYTFLLQEEPLPVEQKSCRKGSQGKNHLMIDMTLLRYYRRQYTNMSLTWVNFKMAYDMIYHS